MMLICFENIGVIYWNRNRKRSLLSVMKRVLFIVLLCGTIILVFAGCSKEKIEEKGSNNQDELFMLGLTLADGRYISFAFEVPYLHSNDTSLFDAFMKQQITVEDFFNQLEHVDTLWDGSSKIYHYDKKKKKFGDEDFYVISCNTIDHHQDIYIAKNKENLMNKCSMKIDDLENVSMIIKEGTLTRIGATVIITDTSNRNNVYGESYKIEKKENGMWIELQPKHDMVFTSIGYSVNENHILEFKVNWECHYESLPNGTYRILKDTSYAGEGTKHYITAEFTIE